MQKSMVLVCVLAVMVWLCPGVSPAAIRIWDGGAVTNLASNPTNWDGDASAPIAGDDIVLNSTSSRDLLWNLTNVASIGSWLQTVDYTGTVTVYTVYPGVAAYTNLLITGNVAISNGMWTHQPNPSGATEVNRLCVSINGNLTLQAPGRIDVTGRGYATGVGPGSAGLAPPRQAASYGGEGGINATFAYTNQTLPCPTYGSIKAPIRLGSGSAEGPGGGAVYITVAGQTTHNGTIVARGGPGGQGGGPSGGSIYLVTDTLVGSGTNDASGGATINRGGGGGGRVAVVLKSGNLFDAVTSVATGTVSGQGTYGAGGTVYLEKQNQAGAGTLIINGGGILPQDSSSITLMPADNPVNLNTDFSEIILTNRANLGVNTNTTLNLGDLSKFKLYGASQSSITLRGTNLVTIPSPLVVSNYTLVVERPMTLNGDVLIATNSALSHTRDFEIQRYGINLTINGNLTVALGGAISADYCGYWLGQGPGKGIGNVPQRVDRGGSYGGESGSRSWGTTNTCITYGSALAPTNLGSGGTANSGGGAVRLVVTGETKLDGRISANGNGTASSGSGGSIYLTTSNLTGSGKMDASGAPGTTLSNGGGGGGRVAVILTSGDTFGTVSMTATGGVAGASSGAAGTVYKQTATQGAGKGILVVDNAAVPWPTVQTNVTCVPARTNSSATELLNVTLIVTNTAMVQLTTNIGLDNLYVGSATSRLDLAYFTITIPRAQHSLGLGSNSVINYGSIIWVPPMRGSVLYVR